MCTVVWMTFCWCAFCLHCLGTHFSLFHFDSRIIISLLFFFLLLNVFHAKYMYIFGNCCLNSGNYVMYDANPTCSYGVCGSKHEHTQHKQSHFSLLLFISLIYWSLVSCRKKAQTSDSGSKRFRMYLLRTLTLRS